MPSPSDILLSFYGDDFTGSTDAMESLARSGVRTVLFTEPPTSEMLARHPGIRAFGIAGMSRAQTPEQMRASLPSAFQRLRDSASPIVHYKVCSTFDSSPAIGSIGCVIDIGAEIFATPTIPVIVGAPALGRYCVFGNLFARCGAESQPYRLDRHPSMSKHPTTPMDEADLTKHLAKQTQKSVGLFDITHLALGATAAQHAFDAQLKNDAPPILLIDLLEEAQLAAVGQLIESMTDPEKPLFIVGSSGVESALTAYWKQTGEISDAPIFHPITDAGPLIAVCGSCSPVTAGQIDHAIVQGFAEIAVDVRDLADENTREAAVSRAAASVQREIAAGKSVVLHTGGSKSATRVASAAASQIGPSLGAMVRRAIAKTPVRRIIVAGGDTSGQIARALGIESVEMIAPLTRGSPLCRASAPDSPADNVEITFKGGQIGPVDFFPLVQRGNHADPNRLHSHVADDDPGLQTPGSRAAAGK